MEAKIYNKRGESVGEITLSERIFGLKWNGDLVSQTINSIKSSVRKGTAHAKDRSDVSGGGKKPWKQKGTGRARHGSTRSPIWVGGGVAHGPTNEKNYFRKVNKKARNKALFTLLSAKYKDGEILFVDNIGLDKIKTKEAVSVLKTLSGIKGFEKISYKTGKRVLIYTSKKDENAVKSFKNISSVSVEEMRNMDPLSVANYKYVIVTDPEESLKILSSRNK